MTPAPPYSPPPAALARLRAALVAGRDVEAADLARQLLGSARDAPTLLRDAVLPAVATLGSRYHACQLFLPEVIASLRAVRAVTALLEPAERNPAKVDAPSWVLGCAEGDLHDVGKNLMVLLLRSAGIPVWDLGVDVRPRDFAGEARRRSAGVVGISVVLGAGAACVHGTMEELRRQGLRAGLRVVVGGVAAPVLARAGVAADAFFTDAWAALSWAPRERL